MGQCGKGGKVTEEALEGAPGWGACACGWELCLLVEGVMSPRVEPTDDGGERLLNPGL